MTDRAEASRGREAEIGYATVGMVPDYECGSPDQDAVQVADIVRGRLANAGNARSLVKQLAPKVHSLERPCPNGCHRVLDNAIITGPDARDPSVVRSLDAVAGRVLQS